MVYNVLRVRHHAVPAVRRQMTVSSVPKGHPSSMALVSWLALRMEFVMELME